jgi:hypothetical protein
VAWRQDSEEWARARAAAAAADLQVREGGGLSRASAQWVLRHRLCSEN